MNPRDVVKYIEGEPKIGVVPTEPGLTNVNGERVVGMNTENYLSFEYYGIQRIERETSILKRQLVTTGKLRQIPRTENNPQKVSSGKEEVPRPS